MKEERPKYLRLRHTNFQTHYSLCETNSTLTRQNTPKWNGKSLMIQNCNRESSSGSYLICFHQLCKSCSSATKSGEKKIKIFLISGSQLTSKLYKPQKLKYQLALFFPLNFILFFGGLKFFAFRTNIYIQATLFVFISSTFWASK